MSKIIEGIALMLMNYTSTLIESGLPDEPTDGQFIEIKDATIVAWATLETYGDRLAVSTTNPYDDKAVSEAKEACENTAKKYGFVLPVIV